MCTEYISQREQFTNYIYCQLNCLNHDVFSPIGIHMVVLSMLPSMFQSSTVLIKSFAHLNGIFFLAFLEVIGKFWKGWTVYSGVLQLTDFLGMIICNGFFMLHYVQS